MCNYQVLRLRQIGYLQSKRTVQPSYTYWHSRHQIQTRCDAQVPALPYPIPSYESNFPGIIFRYPTNERNKAQKQAHETPGLSRSLSYSWKKKDTAPISWLAWPPERFVSIGAVWRSAMVEKSREPVNRAENEVKSRRQEREKVRDSIDSTI